MNKRSESYRKPPCVFFVGSKKKGISEVIATVLIILITVVAVTIIWVALFPLVTELGSYDYSDVRLNIVLRGYTIYFPEGHFAFVQIERGPDDANMTGLEIGFNFEGNTITYLTKVAPGSNNKNIYSFNFTNDSVYGVPRDIAPGKVSVAPVFLFNNKIQVGDILDEKDMPSGGVHLSPKEWEDANDKADDNTVKPGSGGGGGSGTGDSVCSSGEFILGSGIFGNPYMIDNCCQLQNMSYDLNAYYKLDDDINCDIVPYNSGEGFNPIGCGMSNCGTRTAYQYFIGNFDGQGFNITGLYINRPSEHYIGLFGYVGEGVIISNVSVLDVDVFGGYMVGGLVGWGRIIINSYSTGNVKGINRVGGLAGHKQGGEIINSYSTGNISGEDYVGGLVGYNFEGIIINSYSTGNISGEDYVGGLVGINNDGEINDSYSIGNVSGRGIYVGGLVGRNSKTITNSYSTGNISGEDYVGGLVGSNWGTIINSYSIGDVSCTGECSNLGGFAGSSLGSCLGCFWDNEASGQFDSACGTGKTTIQMKQSITFTDAGWDFTTIWNIGGVNDGYPWLMGGIERKLEG